VDGETILRDPEGVEDVATSTTNSAPGTRADHQRDQGVTGKVILARLKMLVTREDARAHRRSSRGMTNGRRAVGFLLDEQSRIRIHRRNHRHPSVRRCRADGGRAGV